MDSLAHDETLLCCSYPELHLSPSLLDVTAKIAHVLQARSSPRALRGSSTRPTPWCKRRRRRHRPRRCGESQGEAAAAAERPRIGDRIRDEISGMWHAPFEPATAREGTSRHWHLESPGRHAQCVFGAVSPTIIPACGVCMASSLYSTGPLPGEKRRRGKERYIYARGSVRSL